MEYTVFDRGAAVGSASAERRGLYWHIAAECRMETERIVRLYAHDGEKRVRLGVLMPEDGALRLERRLAADAFSFTPQTRVTTSPDTEPAAPERPAETPCMHRFFSALSAFRKKPICPIRAVLVFIRNISGNRLPIE